VDIIKAKKVYELSRDNTKILVTLYEGGQVSSCVSEKPPPPESSELPLPTGKQYCETCQCDDETCQDWINHLKEKGYEATEIELGELELAESLPNFLWERGVSVKPKVVLETEENVHADIEAAEAVPGSPGELQPGESGDSSPEIS